MQDLVGGDYNRTPAIFQVPDNLVFVGVSTGFLSPKIRVLYARYVKFFVGKWMLESTSLNVKNSP